MNLSVLIESLENDNARLKARIAELEAAQEWVPVSERLPAVGHPVLVTDGKQVLVGHYIKVDYYSTSGTWECVGCEGYDLEWDFNDWKNEIITHWRELPEFPK